MKWKRIQTTEHAPVPTATPLPTEKKKQKKKRRDNRLVPGGTCNTNRFFTKRFVALWKLTSTLNCQIKRSAERARNPFLLSLLFSLSHLYF